MNPIDMAEVMSDLNEALAAFGFSATYTDDPEVECWGRIDFHGDAWKKKVSAVQRMADVLSDCGASLDRPSKRFFRDQHLTTLCDFAYQVIRQLPADRRMT